MTFVQFLDAHWSDIYVLAFVIVGAWFLRSWLVARALRGDR